MIRQSLHGDRFVDHFDQALKFRVIRISRIGKVVFHHQTETARVRKQDANASGHFNSLLNVVRDHEDAFQSRRLLLPEGHHFVAQVLGGENIQSAESFIQAKDLRLGDQSSGDPHPLSHSSRNFARIGVMVIVQANQIDCLFDSSLFFGASHQLRHQTNGNVLLDGQPWVKSESLEDNRSIRIDAFQNLAVSQDAAGGRHCQTGETSQQRRFSRTGLT